MNAKVLPDAIFVREQVEKMLEYLIDRHTQYMMSTNPEKGEFDLTTHVNQVRSFIMPTRNASKDLLNAIYKSLPLVKEWDVDDADSLESNQARAYNSGVTQTVDVVRSVIEQML